jgi:hypothetical protein
MKQCYGAHGVAKPSAVSAISSHVGLHANTGDVNAAGRWLQHREADTRCQGDSIHWYGIFESVSSIACALCEELTAPLPDSGNRTARLPPCSKCHLSYHSQIGQYCAVHWLEKTIGDEPLLLHAAAVMGSGFEFQAEFEPANPPFRSPTANPAAGMDTSHKTQELSQN